MRFARLTILTSLMALMLLPAGAQADDTSVYGAYVSRDAEFAQLGKEYARAKRTWLRTDRMRRLLRSVKATRKFIAELSDAVAAQTPSSTEGARAKAYALRALKALSDSQSAVAKAVRAHAQGRRGSQLIWADRAQSRADRAFHYERLARRHWKAAGVQIKPAS